MKVVVEEVRQKVISGITEALKKPLNIATIEDEINANYDYDTKVELAVDQIIGNKDSKIENLEFQEVKTTSSSNSDHKPKMSKAE